jgi:cytochrome b561
MNKPKRLFDRPNSFGWISIALHWTSALVLVSLWLLGKSIGWQAPEDIDARRVLHVTIGLSVWLLLAARIVWRLRVPHPRAAGQGPRTHQIAVLAHALILANIAVMMLSGPLLAWLLPGPSALVDTAWRIHATASTSLAILVLLHIGAALKHLMFDDDETIARIFTPRSKG